ncbi:MAG: sigma-70 family RNA polymerase sigma factor [Planctomycetes bacterium]|nr:sigma-70 family RNA polymerase sigma factor [Planctomycetota bacterium]
MSTLGSTTIAMQNLLDRLAKGDEQAKKDLITRAYERLIIVARKLLGSFVRVRVEEETAGVLAEAYFRLHGALDDIKPTSVREFMGLAALQIRRVLLDKIREMEGRGKEKKKKPIPINGGPATDEAAGGIDPADPDFDEKRRDDAIDLLKAIETLPDELRETVELLFLHGYTQLEASEIVGVHEDTVKKRWATARVKLADKLKGFK